MNSHISHISHTSTDVIAAARSWARAFNNRDAEACAACYTHDAKVSARPLAEVQGRAEIAEFWAQLIDSGYGNVRYLDPQVRFASEKVAFLTSPWAMNKARGMIHEERWELCEGRWLLADDHFEILDQVDCTEAAADIVLVHGAWMGAWCWDGVIEALAERGIRASAVELAGHGLRSDVAAPDSLDVYAEDVVRALSSHGRPVALVGHSLGGLVASRAAELAPELVRSLSYVSAFLLPEGASFSAACAGLEGSMMTDNLAYSPDQSRVGVHESALHQALAHDLSAEAFAASVPKLVLEATGPLTTPLDISRPRWGRIPRYFIECTEDRAIPLALQRSMHQRWIMEGVYRLRSSHSPMLSKTDELAAVLATIAAS